MASDVVTIVIDMIIKGEKKDNLEFYGSSFMGICKIDQKKIN